MRNLSIKKLTNLFKKNKTSNIMREINKAFKQINMTVPNYIKTGYYTEKQLTNLINRFNKTLGETEKVNVRLDKELSKYQVNQPNNVKIYSVPKFKNKEGKYYSLETKYENLDLSNIIAQELAEGEELKIDSNDDMKGKHR